MTGLGLLEFIKLGVYYAGYLYFIAAPLLLWFATRNGKGRMASLALFSGLSVLGYARFVEPRILLTPEHEVLLSKCFNKAGAFRAAVFSDTHNGLFGNAMSIERIARRVNETNPDFVLIPGDFIYFLHPDRVEESFAALGDIKAPVFAVLGNHDLGLPGPDLSGPLKAHLPGFSVRLIDDQPLRLSNSKFAIELTGLSDLWDEQQKLSLLERPATGPRLVLTHNPATVWELTNGMSADLIIGGHTHGGQIYLPFITCWWTSMCGARRYGLSTAHESYFKFEKDLGGLPPARREIMEIKIFTTSGVGMVGLPMRFRAAPRIDVLNVSYKACGSD